MVGRTIHVDSTIYGRTGIYVMCICVCKCSSIFEIPGSVILYDSRGWKDHADGPVLQEGGCG